MKFRCKSIIFEKFGGHPSPHISKWFCALGIYVILPLYGQLCGDRGKSLDQVLWCIKPIRVIWKLKVTDDVEIFSE